MIKHQNRLPKFVLSRGSSDTAFGVSKLAYRKNLEKGLLISLTITIFALRLAVNFGDSRFLAGEKLDEFEFIDIIDIPPPAEEPQLRSENVVEVVPEVADEVPEEVGQVKEIIEHIEELLNDNAEETQLALNSNDMDRYLASNSQLAGVSRTELNLRQRRGANAGNLKFDRGSNLVQDMSGADLDIGGTTARRRETVTAQSSLDLGLSKPVARPSHRPEPRTARKADQLELNQGSGKVLSFASSTIGTEDYKLWNKIISELDRLNKGRYGGANKAIQRRRGGFVILFEYDDGTAHEINWRNDGNVWIRVLGESRRTTSEELRQGLTRLLRLSL